MSQVVLILSGLPASGKSTFARKWVDEDAESRVRINFDDLRATYSDWHGGSWLPFKRDNEKHVKVKAAELATAALTEGKSIVIDNCNLTPKARQPWVDLASSFGVPVEVEDFDTPIPTCVSRDLKREARVGRAVIERMALFTGWIDWSDPDQYEPDERFIVVDVDGTLADCTHRRNYLNTVPKDWDAFFAACHQDPSFSKIVTLVQHLSVKWSILVVSGRPLDKCGLATEGWLYSHLGPRVRHLFMRNDGDRRDDPIVKQEILDLLPKDRIDLVLDDRDRVVEMWRTNGLTCLQVAKGDF